MRPPQTYLPGPSERSVLDARGNVIAVPPGWSLLRPDDAALTRRVKAAGEYWLVQETKGRRVFSRGIWAPQVTIQRLQAELAAERATETYARRRESDARRRQKQQATYVEDFTAAVLEYLAFHPRYAELAQKLAERVAAHATPVGSGTVARTQRIPVERRAQAAVIAWLRHQTTGYDAMVIPRVKGKRRDVRRLLARRSKELLARYRRGDSLDANCPLQQALPPAEASTES